MTNRLLAALTDGVAWAAEAIRGVDARVAAIEARGAPKDGLNGKDGAPGRDGVDGAGVATIVVTESGEAVVALTDGKTFNLGILKGKDGVSIKGEAGVPGRDGKDSPPGKDGLDGKDGKDGRSVVSVAIDGGDLVVTFSDGVTANVGRVCGKDGRDGVDGKDGKDGIGIKGDPGESIVGPRGEPGRDGIDGKDGVGIKGDPGAPGRDGKNGIDGKDGKDADASAVTAMAEELRALRSSVDRATADLAAMRAADATLLERAQKLL